MPGEAATASVGWQKLKEKMRRCELVSVPLLFSQAQFACLLLYRPACSCTPSALIGACQRVAPTHQAFVIHVAIPRRFPVEWLALALVAGSASEEECDMMLVSPGLAAGKCELIGTSFLGVLIS